MADGGVEGEEEGAEEGAGEEGEGAKWPGLLVSSMNRGARLFDIVNISRKFLFGSLL